MQHIFIDPVDVLYEIYHLPYVELWIVFCSHHNANSWNNTKWISVLKLYSTPSNCFGHLFFPSYSHTFSRSFFVCIFIFILKSKLVFIFGSKHKTNVLMGKSHSTLATISKWLNRVNIMLQTNEIRLNCCVVFLFSRWDFVWNSPSFTNSFSYAFLCCLCSCCCFPSKFYEWICLRNSTPNGFLCMCIHKSKRTIVENVFWICEWTVFFFSRFFVVSVCRFVSTFSYV